MSILKAEGLYKTYGDKTLFDHISFHIEENERNRKKHAAEGDRRQ